MNTPHRRDTVFRVSTRAFINEDKLEQVAQETNVLFRKLIKKNSNDSAALLSKYNNRVNKFGKRNSFIYSVSQVIQQFQSEVPVGVPASKFRRNYTAYQLSRTDEETDG